MPDSQAIKKLLFFDLRWLLHKSLKAGKHRSEHFIVRGDTLTEDDYDILRDIAGQCPFTGGSAVRVAPYELPHAEAVTYLGEDQGKEACEAEERRQVDEPGSTLEIKISPNPASEMLTVFLTKTFSGTWSILDIAGNVVLKGEYSTASNLFSIPLGDIAGGIYFFRLTDESNCLVSGKINDYRHTSKLR